MSTVRRRIHAVSTLRPALWGLLAVSAGAVIAALVWQAMVAAGNPEPTAPNLGVGSVILTTGLLVFREGLEAILVMAALTASLNGSNRPYRRSLAAGAAVALGASVVTWFVVVAILDSVNAPALDVQAATGLLAIVVLLVVMNWFFHSVYWTGWISHHNRRERKLLASDDDGSSRVGFGLALLGFTAVYREGFEVVLFLQNLRLRAGSSIVLPGVLIGLAFTAVVGYLTFAANARLPYKRMLVMTGVMLGGVLLVMVGESAQEMQLAHWISTTPVNLPIPQWMGVWFAVFPTVESLALQLAAGAFVIGSYFLARYVRVWHPRRKARAAMRARETSAV